MNDSPTKKSRKNENFPVGSIFLPAACRRDVHAFYAFARLADDIADSPGASAEHKRRQLRGLDDALARGLVPGDNPEIAGLLAAEQRCPGLVAHARELLKAFMMDCDKHRYANWQELLDYCRYSANPVGRALLDACDEPEADRTAADALCSALQILNHLQDMQEDYIVRKRVYLPDDWMRQAGAYEEMLEEDSSPDALREVKEKVLEATARLLSTAQTLPPSLEGRGMRIEAATILAVAERLLARLAERDPLAEPVKLTPFQYCACVIDGLVNGWTRP